jgi:hypothetical protein
VAAGRGSIALTFSLFCREDARFLYKRIPDEVKQVMDARSLGPRFLGWKPACTPRLADPCLALLHTAEQRRAAKELRGAATNMEQRL